MFGYQKGSPSSVLVHSYPFRATEASALHVLSIHTFTAPSDGLLPLNQTLSREVFEPSRTIQSIHVTTMPNPNPNPPATDPFGAPRRSTLSNSRHARQNWAELS